MTVTRDVNGEPVDKIYSPDSPNNSIGAVFLFPCLAGLVDCYDNCLFNFRLYNKNEILVFKTNHVYIISKFLLKADAELTQYR